MPVLRCASLGPHEETDLADCCPVSLDNASGCALTVEGICPSTAGLELSVRSSYDGIVYDTEDAYRFDVGGVAGQTVRKTVECAPGGRFFKVICKNLDRSSEATSIAITATVRS